MAEPSAAHVTPAQPSPATALRPAGRGGLPALVDACGRTIAYLRMSITDRCDLRCRYCSAALGPPAPPLSVQELGRLMRVLGRMGVRRVRITGGEPTLRRDLLAVVDELRATPGIEELALTTNGQHLAPLATPLRRAGIECLNVSLDTLDPARFEAIAGRGARLSRVLAGIDAAAAAGFAHLKVNAVVLGGVNEDELGALVRWAWSRGATPRFIEQMPFGEGRRVPVARVKQLLAQQGILLRPDAGRGWGPAHYMRADGEGSGVHGRVGFIGAMSEGFCDQCNRVRVSSAGDLHPCLGAVRGLPLRPLLRAGVEDGALERAIREALRGKAPRHRMGAAPLASMVRIGG